MRPTAARLVRPSVLVALCAAPLLAVACGNPMAPGEKSGRITADAGHDSAGRTGGSQPWFSATPDTATRSGGSQPWFDGGTRSGGSQPWFDGGTRSGGSQPWF